MKGFLRVLAIVLAVVILAACAQATETHWRIAIKADNGAGSYSAASSHFGVYPTSSNGVDTVAPTQDLEAPYGVDTNATLRWAVGYIPGDTRTWGRDFLAPGTWTRSWYIRVASGPLANTDPIRLQFYTLSTAIMPPLGVVGGVPVFYWLILTDNKGKPGAPASGTYWVLPIPAAHSSSPFYTLPVTLPVIKLSSYSHANMLNEGYQFKLTQQLVPEPSGLLAVSIGLSGLLAFRLRRRTRPR
jgi:hypothetical protein